MQSFVVPEPVWTIRPEAAFCVKTRSLLDNQEKTFLNFCTCDELPCPELIDEDQLTLILDSPEPGSYKIPLSLGEKHNEIDKSGQSCSAYDVIINRRFYEERLKTSELFRTFAVIVAVDALYDKYGVRLDKDNFVVLKNRKSVGEIANQNIRQKAKPMIVELDSQEPSAAVVTGAKTPKFTLTKDSARNSTKINGEFRLLGVKRGSDIELRVGNDRIAIATNDDRYYLDICLPFEIRIDNVTAEFSSKKGILYLSMPIANKK